MVLLATSAQPWVPEKAHATAEQVTAARTLANEARLSRETGKPVELELDNAELEAISAMVTQGFAPNRFDASLQDGVLTLTGSRPLLFRWINIRAQASGSSEGVPDFAVSIGSIPLPRWLSQWGLGLIQRRMAANGGTLPPIETILRSTRIGSDTLTAKVLVPQGSLLAHARATGTPAIDEDAVAAIHCGLANQQSSTPAPMLVHQLRRALAATEPTPEGHGAALVALALFSLGPDAKELAGNNGALGSCTASPMQLTLQGREDWAKHWALSAALEATTGSRISAAIGEWKELADTLARSPLLAPGDPSGFSFVDLASDRAGMMTARSLLDPDELVATRAKLLSAQDGDLLPAAALDLDDGLTEAEFAARYGATDDPRFEAKVDAIDEMLRRGGIG
ncbi:MAG: hypothetical protein JJ970_01360 [Erythrobacter sp.]|uniref:hypothetical protein n=1 Tax=Erythrobacter sp. TaxID=1042 RepID=UPI001B207C09|nr:hypothetical protein [Erythrobacter sp.]MBO6527938.1 hypothetical protein [Erythrobacter sp.]MBO6528669.1 hypothetical protein [Erythrobacter sp.]